MVQIFQRTFDHKMKNLWGAMELKTCLFGCLGLGRTLEHVIILGSYWPGEREERYYALFLHIECMCVRLMSIQSPVAVLVPSDAHGCCC